MIYIDLLDDLDIAITYDTEIKEMSKEVRRTLKDIFRFDKNLECFVGHIEDLTESTIQRLSFFDKVDIDSDIDLKNIDRMVSDYCPIDLLDIPFYSRLLKAPPKTERQRIAIKRMLKNSAMLINGDVGTGKTYMTIGAMNHYLKKNVVGKIIIITVPIVKKNWKYEMSKKFGMYLSEDDFYIVDSERNRNPFQSDKKVIIMSHDNMTLLTKDKYRELGKGPPDKQYFRKNPLESDIKSWANNEEILCVVDESHKIKNPTSWRFKTIVPMMSEIAKVRIALTGTLAPNEWIDKYGQMRFLSKKLVGGLPYQEFKEDTCILGNGYSKYAISSYIPEKIKKWDKRWKPYIFRVPKEKVVDVYTRKLMVELSEEHLKIYQTLVQETLYALREKNGKLDFQKVKNAFPYLLLSLADPIMVKDKLIGNNLGLLKDWSLEKNAKFQITKELIKDKCDEENEKMIIWLNNPRVIDDLAKELSDYKPYVIHGQLKYKKGQTKEDYRDEIIEKFNDPTDKVKLLIANPPTIGTGANIVGANNSVFWNLPFDYGQITQTRGRYNRYGQVRAINEWFLVAENTLDEIAFSGMEIKAGLNDTTIDHEVLTVKEYREIFEGRYNIWKTLA